MGRVFDDLIAALHVQPERRWRAVTLCLADHLSSGLAIGVGFAIVHAFAVSGRPSY